MPNRLIYIYFITTLKSTLFFFLNYNLNIGHVTSKHITYSCHEINKVFLSVGFKAEGGGELKLLNNVLI